MGTCYTCVRYLMFVFNFLFMLIGIGFVGLGVWARVDENFQKYVSDEQQLNNMYLAAYFIIVSGTVIMVTSFLGCCGAIAENRVMLVIFFILVLIVAAVFTLLGVVSVVLFSQMNQLEDAIIKGLQKGVDNYFVEDSIGKQYMDIIQREFECCGAAHGILDYPLDKGISVCGTQVEPCADKMMGFIRTSFDVIVAIFFVVGAVAILGMVFSMVLCCKIKDRE